MCMSEDEEKTKDVLNSNKWQLEDLSAKEDGGETPSTTLLMSE